jgi:signal peptidase I
MRQYSYKAQKQLRYRLIKILSGFLVLYVLYNCLTAFFFSIWVMDSAAMRPGLEPGDRLILVSSALPGRIAALRSKEYLPFKRGSIVLVDMNLKNLHKPPLRMFDAAVRFFTAQRASVFSKNEQFYIKRIIGFPGDEISMTNFVFRVKPRDSSYSLTEFELSDTPYYPDIPQTPALWDETLPFSGNMDRIILGPDECFVVSDDRGNTNDSRAWGPVPLSLIAARVVFRFWPVSRIGRP